MMGETEKEEIIKIALKNALDYGKARESTVINGMLSKFPELRSNLKDLSQAVKSEVERVNALSKNDLESEASEYMGEFQQKEKEKELKTAKPKMILEGAVKNDFMTRFPPEPNGYMHIGHAKAVFMEREFADIYSGKLALYFDDTNPEAERQEYVDAFRKDLKWLGIDFDTEYFASDNIEKLYEYAEKLINDGKAYVCMCDADLVKENRKTGTDCEHKKQGGDINLELWKGMLGKKRKDAILRFNGDMKSQNTAMRDPTLFRIKEDKHYRQKSKYVVWPTYDFNTPIMDSMNGITDAMRSKEYELRDELYYTILDLLGLRKPRVHSFARLEISDNITSKRKLKEFIDQKLVWGWDDPRLVTIAGLRRRGIDPKAIKEFVLRFGLSKTNSEVGIDMLLAENRKIIDSKARRLFFIGNPQKLSVTGIPEDIADVKMSLHPTEKLGYRQYHLSSVFFINASDTKYLKDGDRLRLKDAFDIEIGKGKNGTEAKYVEGRDEGATRLQWVNEGNYVKAKALTIGNLLDGEAFNKKSISVMEGYVEGYANGLSEGDVVQFEKLGFFKLDDRKAMSFISI